MSTVKKLMTGLETKYKVATVLAPVTIMGEVFLEVLIPLIMARIIDVGIPNHDAKYVTLVGLLMIGASLLSRLRCPFRMSCSNCVPGLFTQPAPQAFQQGAGLFVLQRG